MRLPEKHMKHKKVRVSIREVSDDSTYLKGAKSESFIVLDISAKDLKDFFLNKIKEQ